MTLTDKIRLLEQSGLFDAQYYVERYPDVARCAMMPVEHYVRIGAALGRRSSGNRDIAVAATLLAAPHVVLPADPSPAVAQRDPSIVSDAPGLDPRRHGTPAAGSARADRPSTAMIERDLAKVPPIVSSYRHYKDALFEKIESLADLPAMPTDIEIDTDHTGPAHGTPFDSFVSKRQREDSATQTLRMLRFGVAAINPRPGVHAARAEDGALIRYRSIPSAEELISRLPSSMLIHIHAFYPDVVEEMLDCFVDDATQGRFLLTTTTQKNYDAISTLLEERGLTGHKTILIENKGRDVGPLLDHAIDYASDADTICHIHTKKSPDVGGSYGERWRKSLYGTLLTQTAVDAFTDSKLGLLFPDTSRSVGWGKNLPFCEEIAERFGRRLPAHPGPIPIGNMLFARVEVVRAMRDATRGVKWPREPVPYDGTILHAVERMWPMACDHAGLEWAAIHLQSASQDAEAPKSEAGTSERPA